MEYLNMTALFDRYNRVEELRQVAKGACMFLRQWKIDANGNVDAIGNAYIKMKFYESQNADLAAMVATNKALWELINERTLDLTLDVDKAIYVLQLAEPAILIATIIDRE